MYSNPCVCLRRPAEDNVVLCTKYTGTIFTRTMYKHDASLIHPTTPHPQARRLGSHRVSFRVLFSLVVGRSHVQAGFSQLYVAATGAGAAVDWRPRKAGLKRKLLSCRYRRITVKTRITRRGAANLREGAGGAGVVLSCFLRLRRPSTNQTIPFERDHLFMSSKEAPPTFFMFSTLRR